MGKENPFAVLVVVLALVIYGWWSLRNSPAPFVTVEQGQTESNGVDIVSTNTTNTATPISYANALVKYNDARIPLNDGCQATPNVMTYKNNTNECIDPDDGHGVIISSYLIS